MNRFEDPTDRIIESIDPKNFVHPYGDVSAQNDIALMDKLSIKFETNEPHKKYADVFEGIMKSEGNI